MVKMATGNELDLASRSSAYGTFVSAKRARTVHLGELTKIYNELERKMISHENAEVVKTLNSKLCERFEQFRSVHSECLEMCSDPDVKSTLELDYDSRDKNFVEFRERFSQWISGDNSGEKTPDDNDVCSTVSRSSLSTVSSRSKLKNAKAKRLIAELKLKTLSKKHELERSRKEIELKQQILDQQSELEEAKLEESVWQEAMAEETGSNTENFNQTPVIEITSGETNSVTGNGNNTDSNIQSKTGNTVSKQSELHAGKNVNCSGSSDSARDHNRSTSGYFDADDRSVMNNHHNDGDARENSDMRIHSRAVNNTSSLNNMNSEISASSIDSAFQRLASTLHEGFNLPKPEILSFSGKPTDYCKFIKNFETNIESRIPDDRLKLSYLIQYCYGEAKCCIEDCVLLEPSDGYRRAREILFFRYGRPHVITRTYVENLVYGPQIAVSDTDGLLKLALEMQKCEITLSQLGFSSDIDNSENLRRIVKRLPIHLRVKWVDIAHVINESGREARFSDLARFVDEKSRVANSMYGMDLAREKKSQKFEDKVTSGRSHGSAHTKGVTTLTTQSNSDERKHDDRRVERKCRCCHGNCVDLASCKKFKALSLSDRKILVRKNKLCYNCLKGNHFSSNCRKPKACTVPDCEYKHNILLHSWATPNSESIETPTTVSCSYVKNSNVKNCLGIIPVIVKGRNGNSCSTYALLDDGADKTLCDERLLQTLKVPCNPVTFQISTVNSTSSTNHGYAVDLTVTSVNGKGTDEVSLKNIWSVKKLPISTRSTATNVDIKKLPYLSDIDIPRIDTSNVMLLIGTDSPAAHVPLEVRSGNSDQPYAVRSRLGWAVRGPVEETDATSTSTVNVNFQQSRDALLQQQLERMWNTEFDYKLLHEKDSMSVEDKRAMQIMESSLTHEDGHYKLGLPWRKENTSLPNNIPLAHVRLQQLKRKLSRDPALHKMYTTTLNDYIEKGYATEVTDVETSSNRVWYLPHHPVANVNKPGKVRVVFDCAAKYRGVSLNSQLLQGPDLMNSLVGVLIRFRKENVALAADVESMFHQVRVTEEDCDSLRFLWWPGGDTQQQPKCYCMQVHLFGATSSPSCAAYALKRTARDNADLYEPEVITTVERNFYVDDCLTSVQTEEKAIALATDLQSLMKLGGFRLTKWLSNSRNVLNAIPVSERAPSVVDLSCQDLLPCDRALGVLWSVNDDKIQFKVKLAEKPLTRRGILSVVSSIYDPLGLVSPVTLQAKAIIQQLCRLKIGWDDDIPQNIRNEWHTWLSTLPCLEKLSVNRCYRPQGFGDTKNLQLHIFCDGSELGYGACAYLRYVDKLDHVYCSLVLGKSRLAPIKQMSIPRLELSGAVVACHIFAMLSDELDTKIDQVTFWTDSTIVLGYIRNESKRFKTFVGNRLSIIHDITSADQWRHINTESNPADIASRGVHADDTHNLQKWLYGPAFLLKDPDRWPKNPISPDVADDDIELKKEVTINTTSAVEILDGLFDRYSCWTRLRRAIAWLLRYKKFCRRRYLNHGLEVKDGNLSLEEIHDAEHCILIHVQTSTFECEMKTLKNMKPVRIDSSIASLNPVIYDNLIRVQGRIQSTNPSECPIILPNRHIVTKLIILHIHENNGHAGKQQVLSLSREKYWILRGPSTVKGVVRSCIVCRRQHAPLLNQQMVPLLEEQTTPDQPPFTNVGIDYFGPLVVKSGRTSVKRYGCLFTCLSTRAVHLEVAHTLTTDSFLAAFQRFTCRRGYPAKVYSDRGTNLVSGDRRLRQSIQEWNTTKIGKYMTEKEIEWLFNPPQASHRGGAWERLIRSTRSILKALVKQQLLTDEQLVTLMAETERILNDRPITEVSDDPDDLSALTPNMLLLLKPNTSIPRGVCKKADNYEKRWWKQIQYLANVFWRRWIREYLPGLQYRQKWQRKTTDLRIGDLVLVSEENSPRGHWPLGRVVNIRKSRDGHLRSCVVKYRNTQTVKPITKLCLLESSA